MRTGLLFLRIAPFAQSKRALTECAPAASFKAEIRFNTSLAREVREARADKTVERHQKNAHSEFRNAAPLAAM